MKHKILANHLMGAFFALLLSVSAVGNLSTGYNLEVEALSELFLWCACFAVVSALLFRLKHGGMILIVLTILAVPVIWKNGALWEQLQSLSYRISFHYHEIYNWPILGKPVTNEADLPLIVLSAWSAFSVSWSFCRRKHLTTILPSVLLPVVLCMITTDRVPDEIYLFLLIFSLVLLFLTDWSRRNQPVQGVQLTLRLAIPVAVVLVLLFVANPQDSYVNHAGEFQKEVVSWFQSLQDRTAFITSGTSFEAATSQKLNLKYVGPKRKSTRSVMRVKAPVGGTIYLRGRDYDRYSGTGWESSLSRNEVFSSGTASLGTLSIVTYGVKDVLYVPYYATDEIRLVDGAKDNDENLTKYSYSLSGAASGSSGMLDNDYTELPPDTLQWASRLEVIVDTASATNREKIRRIETYVQSSARYDLSTGRMDSGYHDFAQWFLEESDTGYCVHFATAATVLLRAAGIPARYVEGYMVTCRAGQETVVQAQHAHAWAEYYDYDSGTWRVLEATPADLTEEPTETTMTTLPRETEPYSPTTEFTEPEDTTTIADPERETKPLNQDNLPGDMPGSTNHKEPFKLPGWIWSVIRLLLVLAVIPLQSHIRMDWKKKQWNRGQPNQKAMARWRQTRQFAKLLNNPYPEELESLAQKANFSQHRIRADELKLFDDYLETLMQTARSKPWYQRILLRWIAAIES